MLTARHRSASCLSIIFAAALSTASCAAQTPASSDVPITFDSGGRPSATVVLNGETEFLFAIDTAAQMTMLSPDVVETLDLQPDPERMAQMHGAAGVVTVPMYPLSSLALATQ